MLSQNRSTTVNMCVEREGNMPEWENFDKFLSHRTYVCMEAWERFVEELSCTTLCFPRYSAKHIPSVRPFVCCLSREGHVFTSIVYQCSSDLCRKLILSLCQFRTWPRFHANFCATIMKISQSNIPQQQLKEVRLWVAKSLSVCFKREYEKTVPTF